MGYKYLLTETPYFISLFQIDKGGNAIAETHMEIAVDRFAQLCQAAKFSGVLKDCSAAQFQSLCDTLPTTKLLNMVVGLR